MQAFCKYADGDEVTKELVVAWKKQLVEGGYAVRSINSMLASMNCLLDFLGLPNCKVKSIRTQRQIYCTEDKELTKAEYLRLLEASKKNEQLNLVLQTICGTGIRVSELRYFIVEAVRHGEITVNCKSKTRTILVNCSPSSGQGCKFLLEVCQIVLSCFFDGNRFDGIKFGRQGIEEQRVNQDRCRRAVDSGYAF